MSPIASRQSILEAFKVLVNTRKTIDVVANLAIITVACLLAVVLIENHLIPRNRDVSVKQISDPQARSLLVKEPTVSSLDIEWSRSQQTLIFAISSTCHFCTESAPLL